MSTVFNDPELWGGEEFELAIEFERVTADVVSAANAAVWSRSWIDGPYVDPDRAPGEQQRVGVDHLTRAWCDSWRPELVASAARRWFRAARRGFRAEPVHPRVTAYGLATIVDGSEVPCRTYARGNGYEWFRFVISDGALEAAGMSSDEPDWGRWAQPLSLMYADLARHIHSRVPILLAVIGLDAAAHIDASARELSRTGVPATRPHVALLTPRGPGALDWHPATSW